MKRFLCFLMCVFCFGCISVSDPMNAPSVKQDNSQWIAPSMTSLYPGMSFDEVQDMMGEGLKIGYVRCEDCEKGYKNMLMKNPYRVEIVKSGGKEYKVYYYYTSIKNADGFVAEDELMPMVFERDTLVGKGQDYLFNLRNL